MIEITYQRARDVAIPAAKELQRLVDIDTSFLYLSVLPLLEATQDAIEKAIYASNGDGVSEDHMLHIDKDQIPLYTVLEVFPRTLGLNMSARLKEYVDRSAVKR